MTVVAGLQKIRARIGWVAEAGTVEGLGHCTDIVSEEARFTPGFLAGEGRSKGFTAGGANTGAP